VRHSWTSVFLSTLVVACGAPEGESGTSGQTEVSGDAGSGLGGDSGDGTIGEAGGESSGGDAGSGSGGSGEDDSAGSGLDELDPSVGDMPTDLPPEDLEPQPFFFMQLADTQLGFIVDNQHFEMDLALMQSAIDRANLLKPAFVTVCGDMINKVMGEAQKDAFWEVADTLDPSIPLYLVAGNHDVDNVPTWKTLSWYWDNFGDDEYTFEVEGSLFVVLNSTLLKEPNGAPVAAAAHKEWLIDTLQSAGEGDPLHVILLQHHPWTLVAGDEEDQYYNMPSALRQELFPLFEAAGVRAVFAGHYHQNAWAMVGPIEHITTAAVGRVFSDEPPGLRIVKVYLDHIEHAYYGHEEVPDTIEL